MTDRRWTDKELRVTPEDLVALLDEGLAREFARLIHARSRLTAQGRGSAQEAERLLELSLEVSTD